MQQLPTVFRTRMGDVRSSSHSALRRRLLTIFSPALRYVLIARMRKIQSVRKIEKTTKQLNASRVYKPALTFANCLPQTLLYNDNETDNHLLWAKFLTEFGRRKCPSSVQKGKCSDLLTRGKCELSLQRKDGLCTVSVQPTLYDF